MKSREIFNMLQRKRLKKAAHLFLKSRKIFNMSRSGWKRIVRLFLLFLIAIISICSFAGVVLVWIKVPSTIIDAQLTVNALAFTLDTTWYIPSLEIQEVSIANPEKITIEVEKIEEIVEAGSTIDALKQGYKKQLFSNGTLQLSSQQDYWQRRINFIFQGTSLKLTDVHVDSGAQIRIQQDPTEKNLLFIEILKGRIQGSINTGDTLLLQCSRGAMLQFADTHFVAKSFRTFRVIRFPLIYFENSELKQPLRIALELSASFSREDIGFKNSLISLLKENKYLALVKIQPEHPILNLARKIAIRKIEFETFAGNTRESTIVKEGYIYLTELGNKKLVVKSGDFLKLEKLEKFKIRNLQFKDNLLLTLQGRVGVLKSGIKDYFYSLSPSILEWILSDELLKGLLSVLGSMIAAISALKILAEK